MSESIHPYDPPRSEPAPLHRETSRVRSVWMLVWAIAIIIGGVFVHELLPRSVNWIGTMVMIGGDLCALVGSVYAGVDMTRALRASAVPGDGGRKLLAVGGLLVAAGLNLFLAFTGSIVTVLASTNFRRGRQLRQWGRVLLPPVSRGVTWSQETRALAMMPAFAAEARQTAAQWRENGRTEHASVAAFAALTTDLMSLGAPPRLLAAANQDALDEIRHTELCFSLATALDGQALGPGPFPESHRPRPTTFGRTHALGRLAVDSLVDGALHEGVSARVLAKLARRCESPAVRDMLKEIARDEGRHAAHGWDVVVWCVEQGGKPIESALHAALRALPRVMLSPLPEKARDGGWERLGIHGHALEKGEYLAARADLERRVARLGQREEALAEAC